MLANIVFFHVFMAPEGLSLPLILSVLWLVVAFRCRAAFAGLFQARELSPVEPASSALRSV